MSQNVENILQKKAMLVQFSASVYSGRKKDNRGSQAVSDKYGNDKEMGNFTKQAIPKEYLKDIQSIASEFRTFLYSHTTPWTHKGELLLPTALYDKVMDRERNAKTDFENLIQTFLDNYQDYIETAKMRLNGLFNQEDYPSRSKIAKKFNWFIDFDPVPSGGNLRIDIAQKDIDQISSDIENRNQKSLDIAMKTVWQRVFDSVKALSNKMKEKRKDKTGNDISPIFRDSIIENIKDLVSLLPSLNITDDPALEQARKDLENDLAGIDPDQLRENSTDREDIAKKADAILDNIGNLF